ncbi:conserved Plasmodium protein, unknown function [Plasmodium relictum]|uniref:Uncharacterized protein n=1 Tax=Plasmodium relictum TaxID=85471 RepID=A0A1J1H8M5_PLARL|nr:conserved Plasmodium protein, unknown function [Plasmodium relictum]CRH01259.1 conserved Plasmodium protein, unknown function [Plasmodium relictum]
MTKVFLLFFVFFFKNTVIPEKINDIPLVNYEMVPLQRWKVSAKELIKLKEKLKIFITSEIQREGSRMLRKYYKEFYVLDEDNLNENISKETLDKKEMKTPPFLENTKLDEKGNKNKIKKTFEINGPILII